MWGKERGTAGIARTLHVAILPTTRASHRRELLALLKTAAVRRALLGIVAVRKDLSHCDESRQKVAENGRSEARIAEKRRSEADLSSPRQKSATASLTAAKTSKNLPRNAAVRPFHPHCGAFQQGPPSLRRLPARRRASVGLANCWPIL